jgi:protein MpaA
MQFGWNRITCNPDRWETFNYSSKGHPLLYQEFGFNKLNNKGPVNLLLCGVHGDETPGIYSCFHLVREILFDKPQILRDFRLVVAPIVNPDGFFANSRQNGNGVDPNRNLPTEDWNRLAQETWIKHKKDPRKYPGAKRGSEMESKIQTYLINKYKPDKIISIHAPLGFLDFDGPGDQKYYNLIRVEQRAKFLGLNIEANTENFVKLVDFQFFPGSLGNYAGNERHIPTYTVELPSSDPLMAHNYWSTLKFALLKALSFEVYDGNESNPFFRVENVSYKVAQAKSKPSNDIENNSENANTSRKTISIHFKGNEKTFVLAGSLLFFVTFQLLIFQRKRSLKITEHSDINTVGSAVVESKREVKPVSNEGKSLRYLSKEECAELINSCEHHLQPIVITALNTGMKKIEILNLKWENVDIENGLIMLNKTKKNDRMMPINDTLKKTLLNISRRQDVPYVFYNKTTLKPYRDISKSLKSALRRAGVKNFHFRDLRHTFAYNLMMEGVDNETVMTFLGHKTLSWVSKGRLDKKS